MPYPVTQRDPNAYSNAFNMESENRLRKFTMDRQNTQDQQQATRQTAADARQKAEDDRLAKQREKQNILDHIPFAQSALASGDPNGYVAAALADPRGSQFLSAGGIFDQADVNDPQLSEHLKSFIGLAGPQKPVDPGPLEQVLGPDGKPVFQPRAKAVGQTPYVKPEGGFSLPPGETRYDSTGKPIVTAAPKPAAPVQGMGANGQIDKKYEGQVQAILSYRAPPLPQGRAGPNQAIMAEVYNRDPTYDAPNYGAKSAAIRSFMSGADGKQVDSVNTAVQHLDQLKPLAEALKSGDVQIINKAKQAYARATGKAAPTNFETVANIAAAEVNKVAVGGPGASEDRELSRAALQLKMSGPQIAEAIDNLQGLMAGRLNSVALRYKNGTKLDNFNSLLLPETLDALERHGYGQNQVPQTQPSRSGQPVQVKTPQDAMSLPSGTVFITPDGRQKVRP